MHLAIEIPPTAHDVLRKQAEATGKSVERLAADWVVERSQNHQPAVRDLSFMGGTSEDVQHIREAKLFFDTCDGFENETV